jgi:hypothetical protein
MALLEAAYRKETQALLSTSAKATEYTTQAQKVQSVYSSSKSVPKLKPAAIVDTTLLAKAQFARQNSVLPRSSASKPRTKVIDSLLKEHAVKYELKRLN